MIELSKDDLRQNKEIPMVIVKPTCMICMAFPEIEVLKKDTTAWQQLSNPVPSNRLCLHIRHDLECPHCKVGVISEEEKRKMFHMETEYREEILKRDNLTCQACGYKQKEKPVLVARRKGGESEEAYLFRRFNASLGKSDQPKSLVVAHFSKRYENETFENRHKMENSRTLCVDCHNMETAKHQTESWLKKMNECLWLKKLE